MNALLVISFLAWICNATSLGAKSLQWAAANAFECACHKVQVGTFSNSIASFVHCLRQQVMKQIAKHGIGQGIAELEDLIGLLMGKNSIAISADNEALCVEYLEALISHHTLLCIEMGESLVIKLSNGLAVEAFVNFIDKMDEMKLSELRVHVTIPYLDETNCISMKELLKMEQIKSLIVLNADLDCVQRAIKESSLERISVTCVSVADDSIEAFLDGLVGSIKEVRVRRLLGDNSCTLFDTKVKLQIMNESFPTETVQLDSLHSDQLTLLHMESMKHLIISNCNFSLQGWKYIASRVKDLKTLKISNCNLNDEAIKEFEIPKKLTVFALTDCMMKSEGFHYLINLLENNRSLRRIDLSANRIDTTMISFLLSAVVGKKRLKTLDISNNYLDGNAVDLIMKAYESLPVFSPRSHSRHLTIIMMGNEALENTRWSNIKSRHYELRIKEI